MTKPIIALISLSLGGCFGFFFGNQSTALAQSSTSPQPAFVSWTSAIPPIPGIKVHLSAATSEGATQQLDGMDFTDSEFKNMTWEYSGGAFSFRNVKISTPMQVRFSGAAANTIALLKLIRDVNTEGKTTPLIPSEPGVRSTSGDQKLIGLTIKSPY